MPCLPAFLPLLRRLNCLLLLLLTLALGSAAAAAPIADSLLVRFRTAAPSRQALLTVPANAQTLRRVRALERVDALLPEWGIARVRVRGSAAAALAALRSDPDVLYAEHDHTARASFDPNDPGIGGQWGLYRVSAPGAWDRTKGSPSVIIAVLDTGIDPAHPDLAPKLVPGYNVFDGSASTNDLNGHGTHVAGIAAAVTNNGIGIAGAGFDSRVMPVKVLDTSGNGTYSGIIAGINWAANNGAKVINLSLGGDSYSQSLQNAVDYAWGKGVVVVAAAGNTGNQTREYPGALNNVLCVASTQREDYRSGSSTYGSWVDVAAPGSGILSTTPTYAFSLGQAYGIKQNYDYLSGTSMACPFVAGQAALLAAAGPSLTATQIVDTIKATMDPVPDPTIPGRVNFASALAAVAVVPPGNHAQFVSQSVPPSMVPGLSYPVSVTMRNTGTSTWRASGLYRLGSQCPQDSGGWGQHRVALPHDVSPGQSVTFSFVAQAPLPGRYDFQWQMVQDLVEWFGEKSPGVTVNVSW